MAKPLEELYLACCPFCDYRRLFTAEVELVATYGTHLRDHEDEALQRPSARSRVSGISEVRIAAHAQRIQAARFN